MKKGSFLKTVMVKYSYSWLRFFKRRGVIFSQFNSEDEIIQEIRDTTGRKDIQIIECYYVSV